VWDTCRRLADAVRRWWTDVDAIVYRSRTTTPETSANFAFFVDDGFDVESRALADRTDVPTDLVLHNGFTIGWDIGAGLTRLTHMACSAGARSGTTNDAPIRTSAPDCETNGTRKLSRCSSVVLRVRT
jgi:hypothetical protein